MLKNTTSIGTQAELRAKNFLQGKGLKFIRHQYHSPCGEVDLIMLDKKELVFVEVRYRKYDTFGAPEETVTKKKQQRLIKTALLFQQRYPWTYPYSIRFDIVAILGNQLNFKITWIPNAFGVE